MKKKHLIGALVLGMALCASCTMPVISTRERVLASQAQDQEIEFTIKKLSPAGYSTVKGELDEATAQHLNTSGNKDKYKYCWVADTSSNLPNDGDDAWKNLPNLAGEGNPSRPFMSFEGAEPNQYLVIKRTTDNKKVFESKKVYQRKPYDGKIIIISTEDDNSQLQLSLSQYLTDFEYRVLSAAESDINKDVPAGQNPENWKSNGTNSTLTVNNNNADITYLVRRAAGQDNNIEGDNGYNLASQAFEVTIHYRANNEGITRKDIKDNLTFTVKPEGLEISGLSKFKDNKQSKFTAESLGVMDITETKEIPYETDDTFLLKKGNENGSILLKSDGIKLLGFDFKNKKFENNPSQKGHEMEIEGLDSSIEYEYKDSSKPNDNYTAVPTGKTSFTVPDFGTYLIRVKGASGKIEIENANGYANVNVTFPSEDKVVKVAKPVPPLIYYPDLFEPQVNGEEAKKAEETKKEEEAKKAEEAKQTEEAKKAEEAKQAEEAKKAEEAKQAEETKKAEEAKQTEEMKKPVLQSVQAKKKTGATVSSKKIKAVLNAHSGKLTVTTKNAEVSLSKQVLDAVFGFEAEPLKVSVKTEVLKKDSKEERTITKNKGQLVSRNIYHLSVKVGKDSLNDYDLQDGKLVVTLKTNLKKAPKKLYAMNLATGKKVEASFKAGKVSFKSDIEGKFVLVKK